MVKKNHIFFSLGLIFTSNVTSGAEAEMPKRAWNSASEVGILVTQAELKNWGSAELGGELFWSTLA